MHQFTARRRVEFSETDMAGIVHYSNFFRYMETAEHAFYRALGHSVIMDQYDPPLGFPRVHAECDFKRPLRFEDEVEIQLLVQEQRGKSLTYLFRFFKVTDETKMEVARGKVVVVCVRHQSDGTMQAASIPPELAERIQVAPKELLEEPWK